MKANILSISYFFLYRKTAAKSFVEKTALNWPSPKLLQLLETARPLQHFTIPGGPFLLMSFEQSNQNFLTVNVLADRTSFLRGGSASLFSH